jgi:TIR domain
MPTKVFISWSGPLSQKLGEALHKWLPSTLQAVKPYFSPEDIQKGAKWSSEISGELGTSDIGIICLTRDNTEKPWILFEAGALSKSLEKGRVCTLLFDPEWSDLKGPLTSFQHTRFDRRRLQALGHHDQQRCRRQAVKARPPLF